MVEQKNIKQGPTTWFSIFLIVSIFFGLFVFPYPQGMRWLVSFNTKQCIKQSGGSDCVFYQCMFNGVYRTGYRSLPSKEHCYYREKYFRCVLPEQELEKIKTQVLCP